MIFNILEKRSRYKKDIIFMRNYLLSMKEWALNKLKDNEIERSCPLCNQDWYDIIYKAPIYNFVKCNNCGLVYANHILNDSTINDFYVDNPIYQSAWKHDYEDVLRTKDILTNTSTVNNILRYRNGNGKCLDIGSGLGKLLYELKPHFNEVHGLELNMVTSKICENTFGVPVFNQRLEDLNLEANSYDVVIMDQVLEHLNNFDSLFKHIKRILKPKGILYIGVPNVDSWSLKLFKKNHIHI